MFCWGNTADGELGLGGIEEQNITSPRRVDFDYADSIEDIACGRTHTLLLTKTGKIFSCGNNDHGQLGHDKSRTKLQPVEGLDAYFFRDISCGESHSMALDEEGQIFTWGSNSCGQLGSNTNGEILSKPKIVRALATSHVVQIAAGYSHCLALTNKGELYSWGGNEFGQLGVGSKVGLVSHPSLVSSLAGLPVAYIACGAYHSFALSKSGAVYGWGKNSFGQLGLNSLVDHIYPCQLKTLRSIRVKYIACGEDFSGFLTQEGGVLTCGAGQSGQLGHGSVSNEILPRKVLELMGSTVTQLSCGRRHTVAYITSRQRVYAFGLGGGGQLGSQLMVATSPIVINGPWALDDHMYIEKTFTGGDRCFLSLLPSPGSSSDYRMMEGRSQIWSISPEKMHQCEICPENTVVDQQLMMYLETVLTSLSCVNGSFLLPDDLHQCCTSRHHGLDIDSAQLCFDSISRTTNQSILSLVQSCVGQLISCLVHSPPDVEALRIYLVLPLYHEFNNAKHSASLQGPFASAFMNLKPEANKIVSNWYYMMKADYLEKLVTIYKSVLLLKLRMSRGNNTRQQRYDMSLGDSVITSSLDLLASLNHLNQMKSSILKIPYEIFHLSELQDVVDIRMDYVHWIFDEHSRTSGKTNYFCNYPFLFDAEAKTLLLQTDQTLQMQSAMNEAAQMAVRQFMFSPMPAFVETVVEIHVTRENILQDTIRELSSYSERELKKPLKVSFIGEEAEDAGGVKKEFFLLLLREVLDPKYGMFTSDPESNSIWFSEVTFEDEIMYYLIGMICGLAIYNFTIINLPFPLVLYKKLLNENVDLQDLKDLHPTLGRGLQSLLDYKDDDLEDVFCLKFEITRDVFGEVRSTPLKPNGNEISVNIENKQEYVDLYVDYILNSSVARHFRAFRDAFHKVCGGRVLELFHAHELMEVVIGNENYDWETFENVAEYKGGYSSSDPTIRMFWEVFKELSLDDKKKFLVYLTGTDRIPLQGMKAVKIVIQPTQDEKFLPVAHTCFNLLDLPRYSTKERLKYKLLQAIQHTEGFSIV